MLVIIAGYVLGNCQSRSRNTDIRNDAMVSMVAWRRERKRISNSIRRALERYFRRERDTSGALQSPRKSLKMPLRVDLHLPPPSAGCSMIGAMPRRRVNE